MVLRPQGNLPSSPDTRPAPFILPNGTNNNRIIGPGDEDLPSPDGKPARFFLVPTRPDLVYQQGTNFTAVLQIDPVVPFDVLFNLTAPDGSKRTAQGEKWTVSATPNQREVAAGPLKGGSFSTSLRFKGAPLWHPWPPGPRMAIAFAHPACPAAHRMMRPDREAAPRLGFVRLCLYFRERLAWREGIWAAAHRPIHHDPVGRLCTSSRIDANYNLLHY